MIKLKTHAGLSHLSIWQMCLYTLHLKYILLVHEFPENQTHDLGISAMVYCLNCRNPGTAF